MKKNELKEFEAQLAFPEIAKKKIEGAEENNSEKFEKLKKIEDNVRKGSRIYI
jgi:hypothetical protein